MFLTLVIFKMVCCSQSSMSVVDESSKNFQNCGATTNCASFASFMTQGTNNFQVKLFPGSRKINIPKMKNTICSLYLYQYLEKRKNLKKRYL